MNSFTLSCFCTRKGDLLKITGELIAQKNSSSHDLDRTLDILHDTQREIRELLQKIGKL